MASILNQTKASDDLYEMIRDWVGHLPGGMAITTSLLCTGFAAISGSSVASAATIGRLSLPKMLDAGYERKFTFGIVAAGGTLGILIPPSLFFILFGAMTDVSVGKLFTAGIIPGLIASALFIVYIILHSKHRKYARSEAATWPERLNSAKRGCWLLPLPVVVLGGIYVGIFTPTEAAAVGAIYSLVITLINRQLTGRILLESLLQTLKTTSMIFLIICGALMFGHVITILRIPQQLIDYISSLGLTSLTFIIFVCILFIFLGDCLEVVSITLISLPILHPVLVAFNVDLIWFGVIMCITMEFALITPPVGLNLYVIQGIIPDADLIQVFRGTWPFMLLLLITLVLIFIFPSLAIWLPMAVM
jgi:C4-dicarboxylate transporter DctM subunit